MVSGAGCEGGEEGEGGESLSGMKIQAVDGAIDTPQHLIWRAPLHMSISGA